jgi:hypothetical protein
VSGNERSVAVASLTVPFGNPPPFAAFEHREGREGFEVAVFRSHDGGFVVEGSTAAVEAGKPFTVSYMIELDAQWRTRRGHLRAQSLAGVGQMDVTGDGEGRWTVNGVPAAALDGCLDLDLEASALTNAFPVRRLGLAVGEHAEAPAAWARMGDLRLERLEQRYERIPDGPVGHARFAYAAPAVDFASTIEYDESGLVVAYPGIAVRRA